MGVAPRPLASGRKVLGICAVVGVLFIASMYFGVQCDRATDPPHPSPEPATSP